MDYYRVKRFAHSRESHIKVDLVTKGDLLTGGCW